MMKQQIINEYDIFDEHGNWIGYTQDTEENVKKMCKNNNCKYKEI